MVMLADRRQHKRNDIDWPVSVYSPRLGMFINGRSVDVSSGGAKLYLPLAVPLRPGQVVEINFPRTTTLARAAGCYSRIKTGVVVRVDRTAGTQITTLSGRTKRRQAVAVQFAGQLLNSA